MDVLEADVLDRFRQLQDSEQTPNSIPDFYFGPAKVQNDSIPCLLQKVVQRKQADERIVELTSLQHSLQVHGGEHERITYEDYYKVSVVPFQIGPSSQQGAVIGPDWLLCVRYMC